MKKFISVILCAALAVAYTTAVLAADTDGSETSSEQSTSQTETVVSTDETTTAEVTTATETTAAAETTGKSEETTVPTDTTAGTGETSAPTDTTVPPAQTTEDKAAQLLEELLKKKFYVLYDLNLPVTAKGADTCAVYPSQLETVMYNKETLKAITNAASLIYDETALKNDLGKLKYKLVFKGWNTAKDGSGDDYAVGGIIDVPALVDESGTVTLYAQWEMELISGTLTVGYDIKNPEDATAPSGDAFTFTVTSSNAGLMEYYLFELIGLTEKQVGGVSKIRSGDSITLAQGQYIKLTAMPGEYTVTRLSRDNYVDEPAQTVKVYSEVSEYTMFTPVYVEPLGSLVLAKTGDDRSECVIYNVSGNGISLDVMIPADRDSVTVTSLPLGTYTVTVDNGWSYRQEAGLPFTSALLEYKGQEKTVSFKFKAGLRGYWLAGNSYREFKQNGTK